MSIRQLFRKAMCLSEKQLGDEEKLETNISTPSQETAVPQVEPPRQINSHPHLTFPPENPHHPHLSHFHIFHSSTSDTMVESPEEITPNSSQGRTSFQPTQNASDRSSPPRPHPQRKPTIELEENSEYRPQGGPDYIRILEKYNMLGDSQEGRIICRFVRQGNVSERRPEIIKVQNISPQANQEFLAAVTIGDSDKPQVLKLDFDTGSADFWVFSTLIRPRDILELTAKKHTVFNPHKSRTWKWPEREWGGFLDPFSFHRPRLPWKTKYGDGTEAEGVTGYDTVRLGEVEIKSQAIQLATSYQGPQFLHGTADGVLGLAFGHLNSVEHPGPVKTPLETMIERRLIQERLFTVNLNCGFESFFTFGYVDEESRAGQDIHWVDVDRRGGFWNFNSGYARVGDKKLIRRGGQAIADTGSNLILTHPHISYMIYSRIKGAIFNRKQPGWIYPKDSPVPEVSFSIGNDDRFMITINELNLAHLEVGKGYYFGAIQDNPAYESGGPQFDVFGTPFFRQVYAIFDVEKDRFGVVKKIHEPGVARTLVKQKFTDFMGQEVENSPDGSILEESTYKRQKTMLSEGSRSSGGSALLEEDIYGTPMIYDEPQDMDKGKERAE